VWLVKKGATDRIVTVRNGIIYYGIYNNDNQYETVDAFTSLESTR
jgi:hypothetical protein